ncbi:MAG: sulfotransferase [Cyanobacteria bacterium J06649_4]
MNGLETISEPLLLTKAIAKRLPDDNEKVMLGQSVIITGMHKSGTSLTASVLQAAGIHIGETLMGPGPGNRLGHFEDMDLYSLHYDVLAYLGIHTDGWETQSGLQMPQQFLPAVNDLLHRKQQVDRVWGWKEPRTTLFLDFWKQALPTAKFVFVYRNPWDVVDSLFRRGDRIFDSNPEAAIEAWMTYNTAIIDFCRCHSSDSFLFDVGNYEKGEKRILKQLCDKLNVVLDLSCCAKYQRSELHETGENNCGFAILQQYYPQAIDLYGELGQIADMPLIQASHQPANSANESCQFVSFQDWLEIRRQAKDIEATRAELREFHTQLQQFQSKVSKA